jgi:hypothetical protein
MLFQEILRRSAIGGDDFAGDQAGLRLLEG